MTAMAIGAKKLKDMRIANIVFSWLALRFESMGEL
jgi:hypothetical protein